MQKCDLCIERWTDGKKPICVDACPPHALDAGIIDELKTDVRKAHEWNIDRR